MCWLTVIVNDKWTSYKYVMEDNASQITYFYQYNEEILLSNVSGKLKNVATEHISKCIFSLQNLLLQYYTLVATNYSIVKTFFMVMLKHSLHLVKVGRKQCIG